MNITKQLKLLLSDAYEIEGELTDFIEQCFKEIFKSRAAYAYHLFEEDLSSGREYNGCLQRLEYYQQQIERDDEICKEYKVNKKKEKENE